MPNLSAKNGDSSLLKKFFAGHKKIIYKKNQLILQAEDSPQGVYFLAKGFVRVYTISEQGNELTVNIFTKESFFPMFWAINDTANFYYFEAMSEVVVYRAPRQAFLDYIHTDIAVMNSINELILHSLSSTLIRLQYLVLGNACQRVSCVLVMLFRRFGKIRKSGMQIISFPITQQQVADLIGLTRESVGSVMRNLEQKKIIQRSQRYYAIADFAALLDESCFYKHAYRENKPLPHTY
jgi:CRP-like cAMP-binding protein